MVANDSHLLLSQLYISPNARMWTEFSDLLLENRIGQWWWGHVTKRLCFHLGHTQPFTCPLTWVTAAATLWAVIWRDPCGRASGRPPAKSQQGSETFSTTSWHTESKLLRDLDTEILAKLYVLRFWTHRNHKIINVCCFKPLHLRVICYSAICNYYIDHSV